MPISWKTSDGNTGIAENDYEFAMQHKGKGDREELAPQDRINQAFGEGPAAPEIKDQNAPYSWGMGEDIKGLGVQPDAPADEWEKAYGPRRPMHEQLASFQQRLDATPPEEAGAFRKFLGSLNIMPAPGKPESEWTAKEHFGVLLNTAMAGMGGGWRGAGTIAPRNFRAAFSKIGEPANANEPGGTPGISRQIDPTAAEEAALMDSWNKMVRESKKSDLTVIEGGKGLTTETEPQLQQAQDQRVNWPEDWGTKLPEGKRILSASDYPHIQKAFKEAVEQGKSTSPEVSDYILEKHGIDLSTYMIKRLQETSGIKLEDSAVNATNSGWTPELIGKLKEGFDKGKSFQTLADELGQSRGQVAGKVSRLLKEGLLVDRPTMTSGVEANPEKMARFKELRSKGLSYKEIAQDLNITTSYARVIASRNKI